MKKNLKFIMIAAAALSFAACTPENTDPVTPDEPNKEDPKEEVELNQNLEFTLEMTSVEADQAKVKVSHNGEAKDTWYGFYTEDVTGNELTVINDEIDAMLAEGKISGLKRSRATTVTLRNLTPATEYKYIVFGLSEKGEFYGTHASVKFTTLKAEVQFKENPAWSVAYTGPGEINGTNYEHTVTVTSNDNNPYFITAVTAEELDEYGVKAIAEDNLDYYKSYLAEFNKDNGTNLTINDVLFQGNGMDAFMLEAGYNWVALAIGVGTDGEISGLYATSEVFTIEEEEASEAYASWIGDWTWTGSNGVSWDITFNKGVSNSSYYLIGWEGLELPIAVDWYEEYGMWQINAQDLGEASFGSAGNGTIYLVGNDGKYFYTIDEGIYPVCMGGDVEGGRICIGYSEEDEETGEVVFALDHMHYIADIAGQYYGISETDTWPSFPITITPATRTRSSAQYEKDVMTFANLVKTYKVFGLAK